ncbi:hypothetical protein [Kitasatospora sp. NPDC059817]|uniref:hypothetical protein n=1 Tax=Kitasatospora sp. NPDC059817 TaxID=3346961 RepID=UPI003669739A
MTETEAGPARAGATCPSSLCAPGHLLLGIVRQDGTVAALRPPLTVDAEFTARASAPGLRPPEARFRFAGPCVEAACGQWEGSRCSLGDAVAHAAYEVGADDPDAPLPPCAVRSTCRWWQQSGSAVCRVCDRIVHTTKAPAETTSSRTLSKPGMSPSWPGSPHGSEECTADASSPRAAGSGPVARASAPAAVSGVTEGQFHNSLSSL